MKRIAVSVIVPSFNSQHVISRCLRSLEQQTCQNYEIIVVDSSRDNTSQIVLDCFPQIALYSLPQRKYPGEARNIGAAQAAGEILAFIDSDCIVDQNWIENIMKAHKAPSPLIGGVIDNGNPSSYVGWGHYFSEFSQWMPRTAPGPVKEIPGGCLSIKRWAFEKYGPFPEGTYSEDTALNLRLRKSGEKPLLVPNIKVHHTNQTDIFKLLKKQAMHGRCFAAVRMAESDFSVLRRTLYAILSPFLPFLLFYRICRRIIQRRTYVREFVLASPVVFISLSAWSWGESCGYLSTGNAAKHTRGGNQS
jgi:GT2 family glycosyltransferase